MEILQFIDMAEPTGTNKLLGKSLKDSANILAKPTAEIWYTSISSGRNIAKLKSYTKKSPKPILKILDSFLSYL